MQAVNVHVHVSPNLVLNSIAESDVFFQWASGLRDGGDCITAGLWQSSGFLWVILGCLWPFVRFSHCFVIGAFLNFSFSLRFHCFRALFVIVEIICKFVHFVGLKFDSRTEEQVRKIAFPKSHVFSCHLTGVGHLRILQIILHNQWVP